MISVRYATSLDGTYTLVKDSDDTTPKKAVVVTVTSKGAYSGTVSMKDACDLDFWGIYQFLINKRH
jgi:hypothetical protein